ncbi:interferon-inducible GTPase 5-like [Amia ocellicauda]|uniref:interferon-inducible GTPase 5-like n=1 Tax=Amia ocellicauda TaxID=2972642 RepID=UPI003464C7ED
MASSGVELQAPTPVPVHYPQEFDCVKVNIAVIGESGSGKSTFANAIRAVTTGEERAAPTEIPTESTEYPYGQYPNVSLWELPGIKTHETTAEKYLKQMKCDEFDVFIIITSEHFRDIHFRLGKEIQSKEKNVYFVRSKIESDLTAAQLQSAVYNEDEVLKTIRQKCIDSLKEGGMESACVFLVSGTQPQLYDLPELEKTLEEDITNHKWDAIFSAEELHDVDEEDAVILKHFKNLGLHSVASKLQSHFKTVQEAELNIAITGESGSGKSTFINTIRGLKQNDKGAAKAGVFDSTQVPTAYPYPKHPNVKLWDLPGIGTKNYEAQEYLTRLDFKTYDFFIIITSLRFTTNHTMLAQEIHKMGRKFYFVRSKIDQDIRNEREDKEPSNFNEIEFLKRMRIDCDTHLKDVMKSCRVFLIMGKDMSLYDFPKLLDTFRDDLPKHKKHIFMTALPNISFQMCKKKQKELRKRMWKVALLSAAVSAVPIPGLTVVCNTASLVSELETYYTTFDLDDESLQRMTDEVGKSVEDLKAVIKSPLKDGINFDAVMELMKKASGKRSINTAIALSVFPIVGSVPAGVISYRAAYCMLMSSLKQLAIDAHNVLLKVFERE